MNKSVVVSIKREKGMVTVCNDSGTVWKFPCNIAVDEDTTTGAAVAMVAQSMLTGTIASHLKHSDAKVLTYKLTLITK